MGQIIPFIARVQASGDWTAAERERLEALAERLLAAGGGRVEVIFGTTDEGDPWCVVKDHNEEVLIHVARIDGRFVVHSVVDDAVSEGADLHAALRGQLTLEAVVEPHEAAVVPFGLRQAQTVIALIVAAAFFYDTAFAPGQAQAAEAPPPAAEPDPTPPPPETPGAAQEREIAVQAAALADPVLEPPAARPSVGAEPVAAPGAATAPGLAAVAADVRPAFAGAAEPEAPGAAAGVADPLLIGGTSGDDLLEGGAGAEWLIGGAGDDTLRGGGGQDTLEGGAGDDRIELTAEARATGGAGADTFVLQAPASPGQADALLARVTDLNTGEGDRLVTDQGNAATILSPAPAAPPPGDLAVTAGDTASPALTATSRRVLVDLNGDGAPDGYVLVGPGVWSAKSGWAGSLAEHAEGGAWSGVRFMSPGSWPSGGADLPELSLESIGRGLDLQDLFG